MKRAKIGIIASAVLAVATIAFAQAKADFSGSWAPEADPAAAAPTGGGGGGRGMMAGPMTVKQTADTLTVERTAGENKIVSNYKLDGSESTNTMQGRGRRCRGEVCRQVGWLETGDHQQAARTGRGDCRNHGDLVGCGRGPDNRERGRPWSLEADVQEDDVVGVRRSRLATGTS